MKSVSEILKSPEFLEADPKAKKYVKHEFQDFGYRLAAKLGDLAHRPIYMKLAQSESRALLEAALGFVSDYNDEPNKGKLFMWKLKELRREQHLRKAKQNHDHDFVMKEMASLYDEMHLQMAQRQKQQFNQARENLLTELAKLALQVPRGKKRNTSVLDLGCGSGLDSMHISSLGLKTYGTDVSRHNLKTAKKTCSGCKVNLVHKPHFLKHTYKPLQFELIWCSRLWEIVPRPAEGLYFDHFKLLLGAGGILAIRVKPDPDSEGWQEFELSGKKYIHFKKTGFVEQLITLAGDKGFDLLDSLPFEDSNLVLIWKRR